MNEVTFTKRKMDSITIDGVTYNDYYLSNSGNALYLTEDGLSVDKQYVELIYYCNLYQHLATTIISNHHYQQIAGKLYVPVDIVSDFTDDLIGKEDEIKAQFGV